MFHELILPLLRPFISSSRCFARFSTTPYIYFLTFAIPVTFLLFGVLRALPFVDDVTLSLAAGDDWLNYKQYGLSILHGGLTIPIVTGPYTRPGGFFYNYFLAGVFALFGENSSYVYVIQSFMLGISVSFMYFAFRYKLSPFAGLAYILVLTLFMFTDVFLYYSFRLLSENLLMFLLPIFFFLIVKCYERSSILLAACAGLVFGIAVLTRPNLLIAGIAIPLVCFVDAVKSQRNERFTISFVFVIAWCATFSAMVIRDYAVTGHIGNAVITFNDWQTPQFPKQSSDPAGYLANSALTFIDYYSRRILFTFGFLPLLQEKFPVLPHWIVMWLSFFLFTLITIWKRRPLEIWETVLYSFVLFYLGPLIAVGGISHYGIRMIVPIVPVLLLFSFRLLDLVLVQHRLTEL